MDKFSAKVRHRGEQQTVTLYENGRWMGSLSYNTSSGCLELKLEALKGVRRPRDRVTVSRPASGMAPSVVINLSQER